jgi:hypothetical protein
MKIKTTIKTTHKINAAITRLSDEDPDPIEKDDIAEGYHLLEEGWLPWEPEDILDIRRLIDHHMNVKQKKVFVAFLNGQSYNDIDVTEKYWRWHFAKGVEFIKKELGL